MLSCIKAGASLKSQDIFGETALHYAAENGHLAVVRILLETGADRNVLDNSGRTPLACCLQHKRGQYQMVAELLRQDQNYTQNNSVISAPKGIRCQSFWIDALCINQQDVSERNVQVRLMSRIYGEARYVLVWLGEADRHTELAIKTINRLHSGGNSKEGLSRSLHRFREHREGRVLDQDETPEGIGYSIRELQAILEIFRRPYWQRVWVAQELALAPRFEVHCGPFFMGDHEFAVTASWATLMDAKFIDKRMPSLPTENKLSAAAALVMELRARINPDLHDIKGLRAMLHGASNDGWKSTLSLYDLLLHTWNFAATDPRDKIFALLSLVQRKTDQESVFVDYNTPTASLYATVGRRLLEIGGGCGYFWADNKDLVEPLEALTFVHFPPKCQGIGCKTAHLVQSTKPSEHIHSLPSWVPNFHWPLHATRLWDPRFAASTQQPLRFYSSRPEMFRLDGLLFDSIVEVDSYNKDGSPDRLLVDLHPIARLVSHLAPNYPTGITRSEALWRTVTADNTINPTTGEGVDHGVFKRFITQQLRNCYKGSKGLDVTGLRKIHNILARSSPEDAFTIDDTGSERVCESSRDTITGWWAKLGYQRRLMRTSKEYLVLGSRCAKAGDEIWLLAGGRVPFILRPVNPSSQEFVLVGECYVHGIMYGEAVTDTDNFAPINLV